MAPTDSRMPVVRLDPRQARSLAPDCRVEGLGRLAALHLRSTVRLCVSLQRENLPPRPQKPQMQLDLNGAMNRMQDQPAASYSVKKRLQARPLEDAASNAARPKLPLSSRPQNQPSSGSLVGETAQTSGMNGKPVASKSPRVARETYPGLTQHRVREAAAREAKEVRQVAQNCRQLPRTTRRREVQGSDGRPADLQTRKDACR